MTITQHDKQLLFWVVLLTVLPLAVITTVALLTDLLATGTLVLMVVGWFFGATMTWAYGKYQRRNLANVS